MTSVVYYSLKNGSSFDTFSFEGEEIKVNTFRNNIINKEFLGSLDYNELDVIDFNSRKKYTDEESLKKNSYVIISRVPKIVLTSSMNKFAVSESMKVNHQVATIQPYSVDPVLNDVNNANNEGSAQRNEHNMDESSANVEQLMYRQSQSCSTTSDELLRPVDENIQYYTYCYVDQQSDADPLKHTSSYLPTLQYGSYVRPPAYAYQPTIQQPNLVLSSYVNSSTGIYQNPSSAMPSYTPFMGPPHPLAQPFFSPAIPQPLIHPIHHQPFRLSYPPPTIMTESQFYEEKQRRLDYHNRREYCGSTSMRARRMERFHHCDESGRKKERMKSSSSSYDSRNKVNSKSPIISKKRHHTSDRYSDRDKHYHHHDYSSDDDDYHKSNPRSRKYRYQVDDDKSRHKRSRSKDYYRKSQKHHRDFDNYHSRHKKSPESESYDSDDIIKINNGIDIDTVKKSRKPCRNQIEDVCDEGSRVEKSNKSNTLLTTSHLNDENDKKLSKFSNISNDTNAKSGLCIDESDKTSDKVEQFKANDNQHSLTSTSSSISNDESSDEEKLRKNKFEPCSPKLNTKIISVVTVTTNRKTVSNQLSPNIS